MARSREKKSFFKERSVKDIRDMDCTDVHSPKSLVERIVDLEEDESLCLHLGLTPQKHYRRGGNSNDAARRNLRQGFYARLDQPTTSSAALREKRTPVQIRQKGLEKKLYERGEERIFCLGYSFKTLEDNSKTIYVPFYSIMEGCRRDTYDQKVCKNLPKQFNAGSRFEGYKNTREGATVVVTVPSSTKNSPKYRIRWEHIAAEDTPDKNIFAWKAKPSYDKRNILEEESSEGEPTHSIYNFGYSGSERDSSNWEMIYPQDVHSHQVIIREFMRKGNLIPLERSQMAVPSSFAADFYRKLCNNIIVHDPTLESKYQLRKPHIDEKSMLTARLVGNYGPYETMYWDSERDGRIKDYDW